MPDSTVIPQTIGARLRHARQMRGLSLQDVEAMTGAEFKCSAVGAYERGERIIPSDRLVEIANVYGIPVADLLPAVIASEPEVPSLDGTVNVAALIDQVGCSERQINYWCSQGLVGVHDGDPNPGSGNRRRFSQSDVFDAKVVQVLAGFGFNGWALGNAVRNIREHSPAARLVYIREDGSTDWGPGAVAAIVIDLDQLRLKPVTVDADRKP